MDPKPFKRLPRRRKVMRPGLPSDLPQFFSVNEGVGVESSPERLVRLCRLDEVSRIKWQDLHIFGEEVCSGWESFAAFRIGVSSFLDEIAYVISSPCCAE